MANPDHGVALLAGIACGGLLRAVSLVPPSLGAPTVTLRDVATGAALPATVTPGSAGGLTAPLQRRNVAVFHIESRAVAADRTYRLEVSAGAVTVDAVVRTLPPAGAPELTVLAATCFYLHARKQGAYRAAALSHRYGEARLNVLAGDNVYMDVAPDQRSLDDGWEETAQRYATYFTDRDYVKLLSDRPTVTTWDDHELWNNYPEFQIHLTRTAPWNVAAYEAAAQEAIALVQRPLNPDPVVSGGTSYRLDAGPVRFFVADTRSRRSKIGAPRPRLLPEAELVALESWARGLDRPGVLVLGQPLWLGRGSAITDCNLADFAHHYRRILDALARAPFDVLVVSGDVHHSRALTLYVGDAPIYEVVTSAAVRIPSKLGVVLGRWDGQDDDRVEVPRSVEVDDTGAGRPTLFRYHFGCEVPNTFALLSFRRASANGDCDVGVTFIDSVTGMPAKSVQPKNGLPSGVIGDRYDVCQDETLFVLRKR